ncbi:MAG: FeoA family protein [Firmicutes bacterium]|nr:FeoA family protein [Bacillota bacterium]
MSLADAHMGIDYTIKNIESGDANLENFLFTLGCYSGETVTVISRKKRSLIMAVKNSRYNIDLELARAILV